MDADTTHDDENVSTKPLSFQEQLEELVLTSLDTAKSMLEEYGLIVPFGIRIAKGSSQKKMNCPADKHPDEDWEAQIERVIQELREFVAKEEIAATAMVTSLQNGEQKGIGLQVENELDSVLFVYPYSKKKDEWVIDEPIQTEQLFSCVYDHD